eukprot:g81785.t1
MMTIDNKTRIPRVPELLIDGGAGLTDDDGAVVPLRSLALTEFHNGCTMITESVARVVFPTTRILQTNVEKLIL